MAPPQRFYANLKGADVLYAEEVAKSMSQEYTQGDTEALIEALRLKYGRMPEEESTDDSLSSEGDSAANKRGEGGEKIKHTKKLHISPKEVFPGMYYNQTSQTCQQYQDAKESLRVANPDLSLEDEAEQSKGSNGKANAPGSKDVASGEIVPATPENNRKAKFESGPLNDTSRTLAPLPKRDSQGSPSSEPIDKDTRDNAYIQAEWLSRQKEIEEMENKVQMNGRNPLYGSPQLPDTSNGGHQSGYHVNTRNPPLALKYNSASLAPPVQQFYLTPLALCPGNPARYEGRVVSTSGYIDTPSPNEWNGGFRRISPLQAPPHAQAMAHRATTLAIQQRTVAPELQQAKHRRLMEWVKNVPVGESPESETINNEI